MESNHKYRLISVEYLNALPFIHAFTNSPLLSQFDIQTGTPKECAESLLNDHADIALLPIGALNQFENLHLVSEYCIGCDGEVRTVCIFSDLEFENIKTIKEDPDSRTSNLLLHTLNTHFWASNQKQLLVNGQQTEDADGYLIIGDRAFEAEKKYRYKYDLGKIWKELTGYPFTFAIWVSKTKIPNEVIQSFNQCIKDFLSNEKNLEKILADYPLNLGLKEYYSKNISYEFDQKKRDALTHFFKLLGQSLPVNI